MNALAPETEEQTRERLRKRSADLFAEIERDLEPYEPRATATASGFVDMLITKSAVRSPLQTATGPLAFEYHRDTRVDDGAEMTLFRFQDGDVSHGWYVPVVRDDAGAPIADFSQVPAALRERVFAIATLVPIDELHVYRFKKGCP